MDETHADIYAVLDMIFQRLKALEDKVEQLDRRLDDILESMEE